MLNLSIILALAASALAIPQQLPSLGGMDTATAAGMCGDNMTLHCCNKAEVDKKTEASLPEGLISGLVDSFLGEDGVGGIFGDCSPIEVGGIPGANAILNDQCRAKVACCDKENAVATNGLVNLALPCVAFGSIVG